MRPLFVRSISTLILAFCAAQSWAGPIDLVELTGNVGFSSTTGTGGFEADGPGGDNVERGPFRLVYDPIIPDTDTSETRGLFRGAIKSFEMTVSQINRPDLSFSLVGRGDLYREFSDVAGTDGVTWSMILAEENGVVAPSLFSFRMYRETWGNPNSMPTIDFWPTAIAYIADGAGVQETDWLSSGSITARTVPRPVPAPPTLWLLIIGAAAALFPRVRPGKR